MREGIWLFETKTKGNPKIEQIQRQLTFDLQTMLYVITLKELQEQADVHGAEDFNEAPIRGVRYNVIRRPLSGGKGTIVQHKPSKSNPDGESREDYYKRLAQYIIDDPNEFFIRWRTSISESDITKFKTTCLNPMLESLCQWYESITDSTDADGGFAHVEQSYRMPYGVYSTLLEDVSGDMDAYLESGSTVGLEQVETLFTELAI